MDCGVAEGGNSLCAGITVNAFKHRPAIGVRRRFSQRLIAVNNLAASIHQRTRGVTFVGQDESRGNRTMRTDISCKRIG